MPRLAVVFDTNAYRGVGHAAFAKLRRDEAHHSVIAFASYIVATELLAHLSAHDDEDFDDCLHATARLGAHCSRFDGSAIEVQFMQLADAQIVRQLFDRTLETVAPKAGGYSAVIGAVTSNPRPESALQFSDGLVGLRVQVERSEQEFADRMWSKVVGTLAPDAKTWHDITRSPKRAAILAAIDEGRGLDLVAGTIVDRAAAKAGLTLCPTERDVAITKALAAFPTAIHHHKLLIRELIENGPNMRKPERANSVWDHDLCYSTAPSARVLGIPLVLVTTDRMIRRAAEAASTRSRVWTLVEYRTRLAGRDVDVDAYLNA